MEKTIRIGEVEITQEIRDYVNQILDSGHITEGKFVKLFEEKIKNYLGVKHAITVTNGTVALQLIGEYLKIMVGPLRVCVPAMTFPATANAFILAGHQIVLCDIGEDLQINIDSLSEKQKYNIDVIVPVHLMGYSANMSRIMEEANKYGWLVIEDTAEAFGGEHKTIKLGTMGHFGTYSFYASHNITGGELGLIVTNEDSVAEILRKMKNHGRESLNPLEFNHTYIGGNYKTTEFSAAIGLSHLNRVNELLNTRFENAKYYAEHITNPNLKPYPATNGFSPLGYPIRCTNKEHRDLVCKKLKDNNIETRTIFPCLNSQKAYQHKFGETFPVADMLEKEIFYVGVHHMITQEDRERIVKILNEE
jgi:dTDP-4-amino-4,6-dideoxygalactose transaminase